MIWPDKRVGPGGAGIRAAVIKNNPGFTEVRFTSAAEEGRAGCTQNPVV